MPPLPAATTIHLTSSGRRVQGKNRSVTIKDALRDSPRQHLGTKPAVSAAYLHVPFCFHKCHYCDFYSIVDSQDRQEAFTNRLIEEVAAMGDLVSPEFESVFIGGGTPTLLRVDLWKRLLTVLHRWMPEDRGVEFTVEANPETLTAALAETLAGGQVNRVSIGCQSFDPRHLKTLERWHDPANVDRSMELLRSVGITNINLDLIFAIPGQTLDDWQADLNRAIALAPTHVSCYGLMYEPNTALTRRMLAGDIQRADDELEAAMYDLAVDRLAGAGFEHYEISNWSLRVDQPSQSLQCRHNLAYWTGRNWWALGPSASGHVDGLRWKNVPRLSEYLECGPLPPIVDVERVDEDRRIGEELMLKLRLIDGIDASRVDELLARDDRGRARRAAIARHQESGLLVQVRNRLRLTRRGLLMADSVLCDLV